MTPEIGMAILSVLLTVVGTLSWWSFQRLQDVRIEVAAHKATADARMEEINRRFTQNTDSLDKTIKDFERGVSRVENEVIAVHKRLDTLYSQLADRKA